MQKLILTKCKICGEEKTPRGFSFHISKKHNIKIEDYIVKYEYDGKHPLCKCGCGKKVTIRGYQVMEYRDGHCSIGHFSKERNLKRGNKWRMNLAEGIRRWNKEQKEKNPDYRSGKNNNCYGKKLSEESKEKIRKSVTIQIKEGRHPFIGRSRNRVSRSSLEVKFEDYLNKIGVVYKSNHKIGFYSDEKDYISYKYYDFYLPQFNCLIEIHGTYWHPSNILECKNDIQIKNYKNDIFKKQLALENKYFLLTIYDYQLDDFIQNNEIFLLDQLISTKELVYSGTTNKSIIDLPDYWVGLVDEDSITVHLTPIGNSVTPRVRRVLNNRVEIFFKKFGKIDYYYTIYGERKDVEKLIVEI